MGAGWERGLSILHERHRLSGNTFKRVPSALCDGREKERGQQSQVTSKEKRLELSSLLSLLPTTNDPPPRPLSTLTMGGVSLTRPFSEPAFFTVPSRLLGAHEPQSPPSNPNPGLGPCGVAPSLPHETTKPGGPCAAGKANSQAFTGVHLGDVVRRSDAPLPWKGNEGRERLRSPQCSTRWGTGEAGAVASGGGSHTTTPAN